MAEEPRKQMSVYEVQCGDDTEGTISAESPAKAREMAAEMCQVHDGVKGELKPGPRKD